jgi:regulatory protein
MTGGGRPGGGRRRQPNGPTTTGADAADPEPADPEKVARETCYRMLAVTPRTRAQLAEALQKRQVPDEVADRVLSRFTDVGLIDDEAFARAWVDSRHRTRGLSGRALAAELRRRGVADDTVKEAVLAVGPDEEETAARALIAKRLAATRGLDSTKRMRRLLGMLARKGYAPGLCYRVVREALEDEGAEGLPDAPLD